MFFGETTQVFKKTCVVSWPAFRVPIDEAQVDDAPGKTKFFDDPASSSLIVVKATDLYETRR